MEDPLVDIAVTAANINNVIEDILREVSWTGEAALNHSTDREKMAVDLTTTIAGLTTMIAEIQVDAIMIDKEQMNMNMITTETQ